MKEGLRLQTWEQKAYTRLFREQLVAEPRVLQKVCLNQVGRILRSVTSSVTHQVQYYLTKGGGRGGRRKAGKQEGRKGEREKRCFMGQCLHNKQILETERREVRTERGV